MMVINANAENVEIAEWQEDRLDQTVPEKDSPTIPVPFYTMPKSLFQVTPPYLGPQRIL